MQIRNTNVCSRGHSGRKWEISGQRSAIGGKAGVQTTCLEGPSLATSGHSLAPWTHQFEPPMAAAGMQLPWRWNGGTISTNLDVIWGMPA